PTWRTRSRRTDRRADSVQEWRTATTESPSGGACASWKTAARPTGAWAATLGTRRAVDHQPPRMPVSGTRESGRRRRARLKSSRAWSAVRPGVPRRALGVAGFRWGSAVIRSRPADRLDDHHPLDAATRGVA